MTNQPQCPFCQTSFETVDLLTFHLIFDSCDPQSGEDHPAEPAPAQANRRSSWPELVPES